MNGETLTGLLKKGQMILAQAGIKEAGLDAWLLLEYVTGKSRAYYFAYGEESVTESVAERYLELISRRAGHIPLQHLTHQRLYSASHACSSSSSVTKLFAILFSSRCAFRRF